MYPSSDILQRLRLYLRQRQSELRAAPSLEEQVHLLAEATVAEPEEAPRLEVVEHSTFQAVSVATTSAPNGLTHFLDGVQRQRILYYEGVVPVFYAYLGAVVRSRVERRMCCLKERESLLYREALYAPSRYIDAEGLRAHGIPLRDVEVSEPLPSHPTLLQRIANRISNDREILERELAQQWLQWLHQQGREEWLVVDGGIAGLGEASAGGCLLGLVKTSTAVERALTPEQAQVVYSLRHGERSSVFVIHHRDRSQVYSWFLRLHAPARGSLLYGLVRVEVAPSADWQAMVDVVSSWLLQDRVPLSVPDTRYDRLLYPLRDCEQYLRALAPSSAKLEALARMVYR